jgi:hypothetical protein
MVAAENEIGGAVLVVGILRATVFTPLPESPGFFDPLEARAWARAYLRDHPDLLQSGLDSLTWRAMEAPGEDAQ